MKYLFSILDKSRYALLDELAKKVGLDEKIDLDCVFMSAQNGRSALVGVAGVNLKGEYPRFEHIMIDKPYQKTRLAVIIMREMEKFLKPFGCYVSYIKDSKKHMQNYAEKWGMRPYQKTKTGQWYYKEI